MQFQLTDAYPVLRRTPSVLRAWLLDLPPQWLHANEGPDTFSPHEVLGHLIHGEETDWIPRTKLIMEQGTSLPFESFHRFAHRRLYADLGAQELLDRFQTLRTRNLTELEALALTEDDLERQGRHPELGLVTLRQLLATWVAHDLGHLAQVARIMAKQYKVEVGPWQAYLSVLRSRPSA